MIRLSAQDYAALAALRRQPAGQRFVELLEQSLTEAARTLRTATGERLGWAQGEAQCLAELLKWFEECGRFGG
jgi:hypothetical protein